MVSAQGEPPSVWQKVGECCSGKYGISSYALEIQGVRAGAGRTPYKSWKAYHHEELWPKQCGCASALDPEQMPDKRGWIVLEHRCYSLRQLHADVRECFVAVSTWNVSAQVGPWHVPMMSLANENNSKVHWLEAFEMRLWSCRGGAKKHKTLMASIRISIYKPPCGGSFPCLDSFPVSWQEEQNSFSGWWRHSQMHLNNPNQRYDKLV